MIKIVKFSKYLYAKAKPRGINYPYHNSGKDYFCVFLLKVFFLKKKDVPSDDKNGAVNRNLTHVTNN